MSRWTASTRPHPTARGLATELSDGRRRAYVHTRVLEAEGGRLISIVFDDAGRLIGAFRDQSVPAEAPVEERLQRQHDEIVRAAIGGKIPLP